MKLKIKYADHVEAIAAAPEGEHFRLAGHSLFLPLAPGDLVSAEDGVITGVLDCAQVFMVEAYFPINTAAEIVRDKAKEWATATDVTQPTALTVILSSCSREWIEDEVRPAVWWVELIRVPGAHFDYRQEVLKA